MDLKLKGKKALIVGAGKNIGEAVAKCLAQEGCRLFLVARDEQRLKASGHDHAAMDLRIAGNPAKAAEEALVWAKGCVDIVIHNVGGALNFKDPLGPASDWEDVWRFNAGIAIEMNRILIPPMRKQKWGRIVHVSSIVGELGEPLGEFSGALPYVAAKAYLNAYIKGLSRSVAAENVIVSGVMPGALQAEGKFWDRMMKERPGKVKDFINHFYPVGRLGRPEEIAPFVALLASESAGFASGSLIAVSGGQV